MTPGATGRRSSPDGPAKADTTSLPSLTMSISTAQARATQYGQDLRGLPAASQMESGAAATNRPLCAIDLKKDAVSNRFKIGSTSRP